MKVNAKAIESQNNKTGLRGCVPVTPNKGTVGAHIRVNGASVWCGTYGSREEAAAARSGALNALARLGIK